MAKPPTPLTIRDAADQHRQRHMHVCQALANALNNSIMIPLDTPPTRIPHGTQKADYTGSDTAAQLEAAKARVIELERQWREAGKDWERGQRIEAQIVTAQARAARLDTELGTLGSLQPRAGAMPGKPGLYSVRPPPLLYAGHVIGVYELGPYTLDTRTLPDGLRARLWRYLDSGATIKPYRYKVKQSRYYAEDKAPDDLRSLLNLLASHLLPSELLKPPGESCLITQAQQPCCA